jgi:hypothetical protein
MRKGLASLPATAHKVCRSQTPGSLACMLIAASPLSLAAAGLYVLVVLATVLGGISAHRHRQQPWHARTWLVLALFFTMLVVVRMHDLEEVLREALREVLRARGLYGERRMLQGPLVAGLLVASVSGCLWLAWRSTRRLRGRRNQAVLVAIAAGLAMLLLSALRLVSLHAVDALLYGPLKLNWLGDVGLSVVVAAAALYYGQLLRGMARGS